MYLLPPDHLCCLPNTSICTVQSLHVEGTRSLDHDIRTGRSTWHMEVKWHLAVPAEYMLWQNNNWTEGQNLGALEPKWLVPVVELKSNLTKKINRRLHDGNGAASKIAQNRGRLVWDQRSNSNSILERFTSITYTGPTTTPSNSYF